MRNFIHPLGKRDGNFKEENQKRGRIYNYKELFTPLKGGKVDATLPSTTALAVDIIPTYFD